MVLLKEIDTKAYSRYQYIKEDPKWGESTNNNLDKTKRYYMAVVDKNRQGEKKKVIFEVDLDTNVWFECGEAVTKKNGGGNPS